LVVNIIVLVVIFFQNQILSIHMDGAVQSGLSPITPIDKDPDVHLDMTEIVQSKGFPIEEHFVTTSDGYVLTMFRIPTDGNLKRASRTPVILQHGLLDSSFTWVNNLEHESLGFILASSGFDVWFGNNRGNKYGRNHTSLDPEKRFGGFWEFTWDEMAMFDMPAMVNYVAAKTISEGRNGQVGWVGHSEGTIQMFAAASTTPPFVSEELTKALNKVSLFVALAPVAYVSNHRSKLLNALAYSPLLQTLYDKGKREFMPDGSIDTFAPEICRMVDKACDFFLMAIAGPTVNINSSRIQVYVSQTPAGTSTKNLLHWTQGVKYPVFQRFDFGSSAANFAHYGSFAPPSYNLSQLSVPTALFYGSHDYLADEEDVNKIIAEAGPSGNLVHVEEVDSFAHLDFTWAVDANVKVISTC